MNALAAAALASGELICEFSDGYRKSLLAALAGDVPRTELVLLYRSLSSDAAQVLVSGRAGGRPVLVREGEQRLHLIEPEGASARVTTLTSCVQAAVRDGEERCTRFAARHAWHFDPGARLHPDAALERQPSGAATGFCQPWKVE
jgi:hypothetical protein